MNCLDTQTRSQIVRCLIEGYSIRSTARMTGASKNTIIKLLNDLGAACAEYHNRHVRNLKVRRMQADEIWCFVGAKAKNVSAEKKQEGWGDVWTWVGIDADTKLVLSYLVGGRDGGWAHDFMEDCASRINNRVQITTDVHRAYLEAVEGAFGADMRRPSPGTCQHVLRRTAEPHYANGDAPLYSPHQWIQQESGQPPPHSRAALHVLQLLPDSSDVAGHYRNGSKNH